MKKTLGAIKRKLTVLLIVAMSINSFGAIVSDNDGSAFITKAEFDALKSSFQSQIDSYNHSIDSKIDGAIAAYLAGITIARDEVEADTWIYDLEWYNKLPTVTYNASYCTDPANPHQELNKGEEYLAAYSNGGYLYAILDDGIGSSTRVISIFYTRPGTGGYTSTYYDWPNSDTDDTYYNKNNAKFLWSDGGNNRHVLESLAYYSSYYWKPGGGNLNSVVQNFYAHGQVNWNDYTVGTPSFFLSFDNKAYPMWTFDPIMFRGSGISKRTLTPSLDLMHHMQNFKTYPKLMLGKADTTAHILDPYNTTSWIDGEMTVSPIKFKAVRKTTGEEKIFDETHGVSLSVNEYTGLQAQIKNTDTTTTKLPQASRSYKAYEWDSTVDKSNVIWNVIRGVSKSPCDLYNKYSMDYEPLKLYEGAPVMTTVPASSLYKITIKTNASAQVNIMEGKFGRTTSGNGNTVKRYNADGTENGYAQNISCNSSGTTFYIRGEKGKRYYCRVNPTSTSVNANVKITSFKYQQME